MEPTWLCHFILINYDLPLYLILRINQISAIIIPNLNLDILGITSACPRQIELALPLLVKFYA